MDLNFEELEKYRVRIGDFKTNPGETFGIFFIPSNSFNLKVMATDGKGFKPGWEHVSVSLPNRCPNWQEMSYIKSLFWGEEETVVQIHPPKSEYINQHPHCLHLWKNTEKKFVLPPNIYIGLK